MSPPYDYLRIYPEPSLVFGQRRRYSGDVVAVNHLQTGHAIAFGEIM